MSAANNIEALKEAAVGLPHVKVFYILENGDWHINEPKEYAITMTREEILEEKKAKKKKDDSAASGGTGEES